jgi:hypothetical protein
MSDGSRAGVEELRATHLVEDQVIVLPDVLELRERQAQAAGDRQVRERADWVDIYLLVAVCVLNSIDAVLMQLLLWHGFAVEGNAVVASIGLWPKIVLVPLAAEIVYVLKPKALWVPLVALSLAVAYTTIGFFAFVR